MSKPYSIFTLVFLLAFGALPSNLKANDSLDEREVILLPAQGRNLVLAEMRGFLEAVQTITAALVENDMKTISKTARNVGMSNARAVPTSLMTKLPKQFRELGASTHIQFDKIAMEANDLGDREVILKKLGNLMLNCTACHATFKLVPKKQGAK